MFHLAKVIFGSFNVVTRFSIAISIFPKINFISVTTLRDTENYYDFLTNQSVLGLSKDSFCESSYAPVLALTINRLKFKSLSLPKTC